MNRKRTRSQSKDLTNEKNNIEFEELKPNTKKRKLSEPKTDNAGDFDAFNISKEVQKKLIDRKITSLFEIQQKAFHPLYNGENTIAAALTGSGKTLSFILPLVEKNKAKDRFQQNAPVIVVMAPVRELAIQIAEEFQSLSDKHKSPKGFYFKVGLCYGGTDVFEQKKQLQSGCDILVGTPGRILDFMQRGNFSLDRIKTVVLDEADRMLDMGFQDDIEKIFDCVYEVRKKLQVCLFSATIHDWVKQTSKKIMRNIEPTHINLVKNLGGKIPVGVKNLAVNCLRTEKLTTIADLISCYGGKNKSTIVFVPTKKECNALMVSEKLESTKKLIIHGDINQKTREASIDAFKKGTINCLVATDVAARGIDIPMVDLVIQSEPPKEIDSYIHRAGRTARAGRTGTCITLYTKVTEGLLTRIEQKAKIKFKKIGAPQRKDIIEANIKDITDNIKNIHESSIEMFNAQSKVIVEQYGAEEGISRLLAYISGQTEEMKARSLLCGAEGFVTYQMEFDNAFHSPSYIWSNLRKILPQNILDKAKGMRTYKTMKGGVFDVEEKDVSEIEMCIKSYKRPNPGFVLSKCEQLPEMTESNSYGGGNSYGGNNRYGGGNNNSNHYSNGGRDGRRENKKDVFIGNLPYNCNEDEVKKFLNKNDVFTNGVNVRMVVDQDTGTHKGYCFVSVFDDAKFKRILGIKNKVLQGKTLKIDDATRKG